MLPERKQFAFNILLIVVLIICLLPFLIVSIYNYPILDDYLVATRMREGSIADFVKWYYTQCGGRYFSALIMAVVYYFETHLFTIVKIFPMVVLLINSAAFYVLYRCFFSKINAVALAFITQFAFLINVHSLITSIYWGLSSIVYYLAGSVLVFFLSYYYKINTQKKHISTYILLLLFLFVIIGSSETMIVIFLLFHIYVAFIYITQFKKINFLIVFIILTALIFSVFSLMAPGYQERMDYNPRLEREVSGTFDVLIFSFKQTFVFTGKTLLTWLKSIFLLPLSFIFLNIISSVKNRINKQNLFKIHPVFALLLFLLIPAAYYPSFFAVNFCEHRVKDFGYYIFVLVWFYNLTVLFVYFINNNKGFKLPWDLNLKKISYFSLLIIIILLIVRPNNVRTVYGDLFKGRAAAYQAQNNKRHIEIYNCKEKECMVERLEEENMPYSLFFENLTPCPYHWVNIYYARYFNKDSIYTAYPDK